MKEKITIQDLTEEAISKKIKNDRITPTAVEDYLSEKLDIIEYLPFQKKREIVDIVVEQVVTEENGVKKVDSITQFLAFIAAMLISHTNLQFSRSTSEDYDALNRCGMLEPIVAMFQKDYSECEALLKMAIADELADNNLNVIVGKFLDGILDKMDGIIDVAKGFAENADLSTLGIDINKEDMAKLLGFLNKIN